MKTAEKQEVLAPEYAVAEYSEFAAQLNELREHNQKVFFNYEDPKGNKDARSHVYKLRQTKSAIDKVRKAAGEDARQLLKDINSQGNSLIEEVEGMIDHHQQHIDAVEEKERQRVAYIQEKIGAISGLKQQAAESENAAALHDTLNSLRGIEVDTSYQEFMAEASLALADAIAFAEKALADAEKREAEQAELERLRKEAAEREQKAREEEIRKEAAEAAKKEAEAKAQAEKEAAERREREYKEAAERAEREKVEAAEAAERKQKEAIEAERRRVEQEAKEKADADAKREADIANQKRIHGEIIKALSAVGISDDSAKAVITAIRKGEVPHMKIVY